MTEIRNKNLFYDDFVSKATTAFKVVLAGKNTPKSLAKWFYPVEIDAMESNCEKVERKISRTKPPEMDELFEYQLSISDSEKGKIELSPKSVSLYMRFMFEATSPTCNELQSIESDYDKVRFIHGFLVFIYKFQNFDHNPSPGVKTIMDKVMLNEDSTNRNKMYEEVMQKYSKYRESNDILSKKMKEFTGIPEFQEKCVCVSSPQNHLVLSLFLPFVLSHDEMYNFWTFPICGPDVNHRRINPNYIFGEHGTDDSSHMNRILCSNKLSYSQSICSVPYVLTNRATNTSNETLVPIDLLFQSRRKLQKIEDKAMVCDKISSSGMSELIGVLDLFYVSKFFSEIMF